MGGQPPRGLRIARGRGVEIQAVAPPAHSFAAGDPYQSFENMKVL
jgi:hypothetical protein